MQAFKTVLMQMIVVTCRGACGWVGQSMQDAHTLYFKEKRFEKKGPLREEIDDKKVEKFRKKEQAYESK